MFRLSVFIMFDVESLVEVDFKGTIGSIVSNMELFFLIFVSDFFTPPSDSAFCTLDLTGFEDFTEV